MLDTYIQYFSSLYKEQGNQVKLSQVKDNNKPHCWLSSYYVLDTILHASHELSNTILIIPPWST